MNSASPFQGWIVTLWYSVLGLTPKPIWRFGSLVWTRTVTGLLIGPSTRYRVSRTLSPSATVVTSASIVIEPLLVPPSVASTVVSRNPDLTVQYWASSLEVSWSPAWSSMDLMDAQ